MSAPLALPRRLGEYLLIERIGSGTAGVVYRGRRASGGIIQPEDLAIKVLNDAGAADLARSRRFRHEAELAIAINSTRVLRVLEVARLEDHLVIVSALVNGRSLASVLDALVKVAQRTPIDAACEIVADLLEALEAVHGAYDVTTGSLLDAVHRDVAPKNMVLDAEGRLTLIDFGLGRSRLQDWRTRAGAVMGTPRYMAPEQALGTPADHRADLYSAGVILFELLTLERYLAGATLEAQLREAASPRRRPPSEARGDIPRALDLVVVKALAVDRDNRFSDARSFRAALHSAVSIDADRSAARALVSMLFGEGTRATVFAELKIDPSAADVSVLPTRTTFIARRSHPLIRPRRRLVPAAALLISASALFAAALALLDADQARHADFSLGDSIDYEQADEAPGPKAVARTPRVNESRGDPAQDEDRRARGRKVRKVLERPHPTAPIPKAIEAREQQLTRAEIEDEIQDEIARMSRRAGELRAGKNPRGSELDTIMGELSLWSHSKDLERAKAAIAKLSARLDAIEGR